MYLSDRNTRIASLIFNIFCVKSLLKKVVDPHVWSQARIRMYTDRRDRGERKKKGFFPARHDRGFAAQFSPQTTAKKTLWHPGYPGACCPRKFFRF